MLLFFQILGALAALWFFNFIGVMLSRIDDRLQEIRDVLMQEAANGD
jgi:hypothetical protein